MLLERKILINLQKYLYNDVMRKKYATRFESPLDRNESGLEGFLGFLRHEKHLRVNLIDRFILELRTLKVCFGIKNTKEQIISPQANSVKRYALWEEKIVDAVNWCESKGFLKKEYELMLGNKISLLPEGRRFIKIPRFMNEVAKEYGPLKSFISGTGIGGAIIFLLGAIAKYFHLI